MWLTCDMSCDMYSVEVTVGEKMFLLQQKMLKVKRYQRMVHGEHAHRVSTPTGWVAGTEHA